jgi:hypothetical protein
MRRSTTESKFLMTKRQLISEIRELNNHAQVRFLAQFDAPSLKQYLEHLKSAQQKSVRIGGWVRRESNLRLVS